MNEPKPQQEPSMEEILASIRRIISEDGQESESGPDTQVDEDKILELTDEVNADPAPFQDEIGDAPALQGEAEPEPVVDPEPEAEPEFRPESPESPVELDTFEPDPLSESKAPMAELDSHLISRGAARASEQSLSDLAASVSRQHGGLRLGGGNRTIEDLVKEVMRPMIKEWLDANLPDLVERLVGREIDRMSRRAEDNH